MKKTYPILEFDSDPEAIIQPGRKDRGFTLPKRCVLSFFGDVVEHYQKQPGSIFLGSIRWETGDVKVYQLTHKGVDIAFIHSWVGAPIVAGVLEDVIALGANKVIACGGCGVLSQDLPVGHVLVPTTAVRDEGTSYHYVSPKREITLNSNAIKAIKTALENDGVKYLECKTWTTDSYFRETQKKVELRKKEGCLCVEMECSAAAAVSEFRGIEFGQILYAGDTVDSEAYDERDWWKCLTTREKIFRLALDACVSFEK